MDIKAILKTLKYGLKARTYNFEIRSFNLPNDGYIEYAQWLHPFEGEKQILQSEIDELRKYLSEGDVAIDVGAYTGDTVIPIALAVGKSGLVLALEPNSYVFTVLEKNSKLNKEKTNIVPLMFAATENDEDIVFYYSDAGFCNGGSHKGLSIWKQSKLFRLKVTGKNLERFIRQEYGDIITKIKYIKVDTEGQDLTVIKSIRKLISECKPFIKAEIFLHTSYEQRLELFSILQDLGYTIYKVIDGSNYKGEIIDQSKLMQWKHYDIFCIPNNMSI